MELGLLRTTKVMDEPVTWQHNRRQTSIENIFALKSINIRDSTNRRSPQVDATFCSSNKTHLDAIFYSMPIEPSSRRNSRETFNHQLEKSRWGGGGYLGIIMID